MMMMVTVVVMLVMISDVDKAWGDRTLLVQPHYRPGLQKFIKLKMNRPYEPSTPHPASAYRNTARPTCVGEAEETAAYAWNGIPGSC